MASRPSQIPAALATSDARRAAAAALRALNRDFLSFEADDATLIDVADRARGLSTALATFPGRARSFEEIRREPEADDVSDGEPIDHFDACFVTGEASPIGLTAAVTRRGDGLEAVVRFHRGFEGMPGHAHGGIVMGVFDDVIGMTIGRLMRISAPTVRVETNFRAPIPLHRDITIRTELSATVGRKRTVRATATDGDTVYAQAEALLVVLDPDRPIITEG